MIKLPGLSISQLKAFKEVIKFLNENKINWAITSGLAAVIYGSKRELYDIDIFISNKKDFYRTAYFFKKYIKEGPKTIRFGQLKGYLGYFSGTYFVMKFCDILFDIDYNVKMKVNQNKFFPWLFSDLETIKINNMVVKVRPLEDIVIQKVLLPRKIDKFDLRYLLKNPNLNRDKLKKKARKFGAWNEVRKYL